MKIIKIIMEIKKFFNLPYESKTFNCLKSNYIRELKSTFFYIYKRNRFNHQFGYASCRAGNKYDRESRR